MRFRLALVVAALAAGAGAVCGEGRPQAFATVGFQVRHVRLDQRCNGGRGVRVPTAPVSKLPAGPVADSVTGALADGSTLTAVTWVYPGKRSVTLHSVRRDCTPNASFGRRGSATVSVPRPAPRRNVVGFPPGALWVDVVAARRQGGAILAGSYGGDWVIGEVTASGDLATSFGDHGWRVLPFHGEVTAALEEPSGRIVIAGDNAGGGCCTRNWAAALSAGGRLENGFGSHGRVELPTGEDSGVASLDREPGGEILAEVAYGNMGCWGTALAMLDPSGRLVPGFERRLQRFWHRLGFGAFVGHTAVDGDGFRIVGTAQRPCYQTVPGRRAPATGLIARFTARGRLVGAVHRFASPMYGSVEAVPYGSELLVFGLPYLDHTQVAVTARQPDGALDLRFGAHGRAEILTPWRGKGAALGTHVSIARDPTGSIVVVAASADRDGAELIRLDP